MKNSFLLVCLSILLFIISGKPVIYGQEIQIKNSLDFKNPFSNFFWSETLGQDSTGFYFLRKSNEKIKNKYLIQKYNFDLDLLYTTPLELNNTETLLLSKPCNNSVLLFLKQWNKSSKKSELIVKTVASNGSLEKEGLVLASETGKNTNYSITFSSEKAKFLVLVERPFSKGKNEKIKLQLVQTSDFKNLWVKEVELNNKSSKKTMNEIAVGDDGVAFLFKKFKRSKKDLVHQLTIFTQNNEQTYNIDLKDYYATQHKINFVNEQLFISGLLVKQGVYNNLCEATWHFSASYDEGIISNVIHEIEPSVINELSSNKNLSTSDKRIRDFVLKDVLFEDNGHLLLLIEKQVSNKVEVGQGNSTTYTYETEYGPLFLVSTDALGNKRWHYIMNKYQKVTSESKTENLGSFAYHLVDGELRLLWNFTEIKSNFPITNFRHWTDCNGNKLNIDRLYGKKSLYAPVLTVITTDGQPKYPELPFNSKTLEKIHIDNSQKMAIDPSFFLPISNDIIILSRSNFLNTEWYKFSLIKF